MENTNAELKCTWTNGVIWMTVTLLTSLLVRFLLWFLLLFRGDYNIYFDEFCMGSLPYLLIPTLFPIGFFAGTYGGYMKRAGKHPENLYGVAHGQYGHPWILWLILQVLIGLLWIGVSLMAIYLGNDMAFGYERDLACIKMYLILASAGYIVDLLLFLMGSFLFQPNLVKANK